ncbi:MAG: molecular chaperone DnaK [Pseudohongiella sp.]|nr:MAG: molecular chaperone DnaK [Pseudohongiella sp.]
MSALNKEQLESLSRALCEQKFSLEKQLEMSRQAASVVVLDQTSVGRLSRMDAIQQQNMALSTRKKSQQQLRAIAAAMQRIDMGDYGYCVNCDDEINYERLRIRPDSPLCLRCQSKSEQSD